MLFDQEGTMRMQSQPAWRLVIAMASAAGCRGAYGQPVAAFTGTQTIAVSATAAYGTKYPARSFAPKLEVSVSAGADDQRTVVMRDKQYAKPYECTLTGRVAQGKLALDPGQACEIPVATPDFCLLKVERCRARVMNRTCALEQDNLGVLTGKLTSGTISQLSVGTWGMELKLSVDGCVLAEGYNKNAPIFVRGGLLTVRTP
jgi:hypothetical protein